MIEQRFGIEATPSDDDPNYPTGATAVYVVLVMVFLFGMMAAFGLEIVVCS
jgi:hypothetical protein